MRSFTRRNFVAAGTAMLAFASQRALAQYEDLTGESVVVSDSTGEEIDLGETGFEFSSRYSDDDYEAESFLFGNDSSVVSIKFVPTGNTPESVNELESTKLVEFYPETNEAGSAILDDGTWLAYSIATRTGLKRSVYIEFQIGAFPEHDLLVDFTSNVETFEADFALLQQVAIAGMPPFLFTGDSEIETLVFPTIAATTGSTNRTTRVGGSTKVNTNPTETPVSGTGADDDFVESVQTHREEFMSSFGDFATALGVFGEDTSTETDQDDALIVMANVSLEWIDYPEQASLLAAPAEFAGLGDLYLNWADEIGLLGQLFTDAFTGVGELAPAFDQIDVVDTIDKQLKAELDPLGEVLPDVLAYTSGVARLREIF